MAVRDRIRKYRESGGAADFVRVEVLVPETRRQEILAAAAALRDRHRQEKLRLQAFIKDAVELYGLRISDNIDLTKLDDLRGRARLVAAALMERGDARAYAMGRRMAVELGSAG